MSLKTFTAVAGHTFYSNLLLASGNRLYFMSYFFAVPVAHEFLNTKSFKLFT